MPPMTNFKKLGNVRRPQHFGRMLSLLLDNGRGNSLCILATDIQLVIIEIV